MIERDSLWKQVIVGKYGEEEESWCPRVKEGYEWECGRQLGVGGKFSRVELVSRWVVGIG